MTQGNFRFASVLAVACALGACATPRQPGSSPSSPTSPSTSPPTPGIATIIAAGADTTITAADAQYLSDVIGPRLTGGDGLRAANAWTATKFREYGADSVWQEAWPFGRAWTRGAFTLRLVSPHERWLEGASWAWAPGTNGPVQGDVAIVDAHSTDEFQRRFAGHLAGKWVLFDPPMPRHNPDAAPLSATDSISLDSARRAYFTPRDSADALWRQVRLDLLANEHVAGYVRDGAKDFALLTMSGSPNRLMSFPYIVVPHETYDELYRLVHAGQPTRLEADITNTLTRDTVMANNTIAEIRGSEHPEELVILGAHIDSWDLGTGATDNGAGVIAVLEAARLLKASGVRPARTIRFVLFSGEEEGLLGSTQYVERHPDEMERIQSVLILDNGTGRITGVALQGRDELDDLWATLFSPLGALGPFKVRSGLKGGTDHLPFAAQGVPAFNFDQRTAGYDHTHHSQVDVDDHLIASELTQAATVMAAVALEFANAKELLPRGKVQQ